jgi:hypothetical protein
MSFPEETTIVLVLFAVVKQGLGSACSSLVKQRLVMMLIAGGASSILYRSTRATTRYRQG